MKAKRNIVRQVRQHRGNIAPETGGDVYPSIYPGVGTLAVEHRQAHGELGQWASATIGHDLAMPVDVGGMPGLTDTNPYTAVGPVETSTVENHRLDGRVLKLRRRAEHAPGPVGTMDHSTYLGLALAQQAAESPSDEQIQSDLVSNI